jgi:hypothetical protein
MDMESDTRPAGVSALARMINVSSLTAGKIAGDTSSVTETAAGRFSAKTFLYALRSLPDGGQRKLYAHPRSTES